MRVQRLEGLLGAALLAVVLGFVVVNLRPGLWFADTTPTGGDLGAHVWGPAYLREVLLGELRLTGWTHDWYAGFPAFTFYMVVPSLLVVMINVGLALPVGFFSHLAAAGAALGVLRLGAPRRWWAGAPKLSRFLVVVVLAVAASTVLVILGAADAASMQLGPLGEISYRHAHIQRALAVLGLPAVAARWAWIGLGGRPAARPAAGAVGAGLSAVDAGRPAARPAAGGVGAGFSAVGAGRPGPQRPPATTPPAGVGLSAVGAGRPGASSVAGGVGAGFSAVGAGRPAARPAAGGVGGRVAGVTAWLRSWPGARPAAAVAAALLAALAVPMHYGVSLKLASVAGVVALPAAVWAMARMAGVHPWGQSLAAAAAVLFLFDRSFNIYGGNLMSTMAGEFAYSLGLACAAVYIGLAARGMASGRHRVLAGGLLALTGLLHLFPAFFALAATAALLVVLPWSRRAWRRRLGWTAATGALAAALGAWWVLPFWWNRGLLNDMGWGKERRYMSALWSRQEFDYTFLANDPPLQPFVAVAAAGAAVFAATRVVAALRSRRARARSRPGSPVGHDGGVPGANSSVGMGREAIKISSEAARGAPDASSSVGVGAGSQPGSSGAPSGVRPPAGPSAVGVGAGSQPGSSGVPSGVRPPAGPSAGGDGASPQTGIDVPAAMTGSGNSPVGVGAVPQSGSPGGVGGGVPGAGAPVGGGATPRPGSPVGPGARLWMALVITAAMFAVAFRMLPEGRLWNVRLLPFYYLTVYLSAALSVGEFLRWAALRIDRAVERRRAARIADRHGARRWRLGSLAGRCAVVAALAVALVWVGLPLRSLPGASTDDDGSYGWGPLRTSELNLGPHWVQYNFEGYEGRDPTAEGGGSPEYWDFVDLMARVGRSRGCGPSLWEYGSGRLGSYGTPMAPMLLPYWTDRCIGSMEGLYFEASATVPYHFLMQSELSAAPSRAQRDLPYSALDVSAGTEHLRIMGVRYYTAFSEPALSGARAEPGLKEVAASGPWVVFEVLDSEPVAGLAELPVVVEGMGHSGDDWMEPSVGAFLAGQGAPLLAVDGPPDWPRMTLPDPSKPPEPPAEMSESAEAPEPVGAPEPVEAAGSVEVPEPPAEPPGLPPEATRAERMRWLSQRLPEAAPRVPVEAAAVRDVVRDSHSVSFSVDRIGSPVLVRTSYFPNWSVSGAEGPYRVTPNFMVVVPTETDVRLTYGRSPVELLGTALTAAGLAAAAWLTIRERRPKRRPAKPRPQ